MWIHSSDIYLLVDVIISRAIWKRSYDISATFKLVPCQFWQYKCMFGLSFMFSTQCLSDEKHSFLLILSFSKKNCYTKNGQLNWGIFFLSGVSQGILYWQRHNSLRFICQPLIVLNWFWICNELVQVAA